MKKVRLLAISLLVLGFAVASVEAHPKTVRISVTKKGFSRTSISTEVGSPLTLIFTRRTTEGCGSKVVFPSLGITKDLPVGKAVTVKFTPKQEGTISFACGMGMYKGSIVAVE